MRFVLFCFCSAGLFVAHRRTSNGGGEAGGPVYVPIWFGLLAVGDVVHRSEKSELCQVGN